MMNGTHYLTFKPVEGNDIIISWDGPDTIKIKNWWVVDTDIAYCIHSFIPEKVVSTSVDTTSN